MTEFWLIASIGHGGTKWLAEVLDSRPDTTATHELKQISSGMAWERAAKYERRNGPGSAKYRPYFDAITRVQTPIAADANSWIPWLIPAVHEIQPISRVIYLVRHGVSQLNSLMNYSQTWLTAGLDDYILGDYLRPFTKLVLSEISFVEISRENSDDWNKWTREERFCLLWASCGFMPDYLRSKGLKVDVYRLEDLTRQRHILSELLPDADGRTLDTWQRKDINRKVPPGESRRPVDIWPTWSEEMREAFTRICNPALKKYGYEVVANR